ncbi:MAG: secretin N-terminal domain-containing protein [Rhabdochlamydiaceae bacterium]|nr:secretin N-terminal domain-containing protein [Candidatus Amphrikana amoebophyrae]
MTPIWSSTTLILIFRKLFLLLILLGFSSSLVAMSLEEKLTAIDSETSNDSFNVEKELLAVNENLSSLKLKLANQLTQARALYDSNATEKEYVDLLSSMKQLKNDIALSETLWRNKSVSQSKDDEEGYALWDQEETSISQLVLEYGSGDYLYIIPPDLANHKLTLHSALPIPRESWDSLMEIVLSHNGIGVKEINPFARQLYSMKQDLLSASIITNDESHLESMPDMARVIYVFSPNPEYFKSAYHFLERFRDPKRTFVYSAGNKITLVSTKEEVMKLVRLYKSVWEKGGEKITRVVSCSKIKTQEMQKVLKSYFGAISEADRFSMAKGVNEISIMPLANESSIVLVGNRDLVTKAEQIIEETEAQFEIPCEMTLYWYNCKHSDPEDIATVLQQVYTSLVCYSINGTDNSKIDAQQNVNIDVNSPENPPYPYPEDPIGNSPNPVEPPPALSGEEPKTPKSNVKLKNFIPYPKTGALMMVVRRDTLNRIQDLVKKLDVPKKMVHVEVLLCERKVTQQTNTGLNLLKLGSAASNVRKTGIDFDQAMKGIFQFFISRAKTGKTIPAFDITYNFLMSQNDIHINASPSLTMINQTPATISLVEEQSINSGAAPIDTNSNITFEKAFIRKQYGITIVMTPTIHEPSKDDDNQDTLVTLKTNITFDTQKNDDNDQPRVDRRHLENQVRVIDGQTIVIGGLRKKATDDKTDKIPFLGEIPGIAKLFGTSKMTDEMTEMFIFITPRVIHDSAQDIESVREHELNKRAGDIPEYLCRLYQARSTKKRKVFEQSFKLFFGNNNG